jgi:hypothetical protein
MSIVEPWHGNKQRIREGAREAVAAQRRDTIDVEVVLVVLALPRV